MSALKKQLRRLFYKMTAGGKPEYHCPICGYRGVFKDKKLYMSREVRVPPNASAAIPRSATA